MKLDAERRPVPLQLKLTVGLVLLAALPVLASVYFIGELGRAAANVNAGEAAERVAILERAIQTNQKLVFEAKRLHGEIANRLASRRGMLALDPAEMGGLLVDTFGLDASLELEAVLRQPAQAGLRRLEILRSDGTLFASAERPPLDGERVDTHVEVPLGTAGSQLHLTFDVFDANKEIQALKDTIDKMKLIMLYKTALPDGYANGFVVIIAISSLAAAALGVWAARFATRRIDALVTTARRVSEGHVDARVELPGSSRDEMAQLGSAFNAMLDNLDETRRQIEYLQRMGVWQDVARRLAHEIKNPLTPIQLAVQECVTQYKGDDPRFKRLLADTGEIVMEEIEALRRLVDTFRTLGALPKVEAAPIALAEVIEDLRLDPAVAPRLTLVPPEVPVTVRADKLLLKRVLANLVENGMQAGQEHGNDGGVTVGWSEDARAERVRITVDDCGKGVDAAAREKIFEPYVTTKSTGTGLGLAIARKIAIEHGGELAVAPDPAPTGGARFVVSLPLR
ncbi:MAG: HAMP domain-containing protein [Deltaproteobacteria bacterium]|nr:HAMP domain-containing protein [Deltaproteobacteria bacterium]